MDAQRREETLVFVECHEAGDRGGTGARTEPRSSLIVLKFRCIVYHVLGDDEIVFVPRQEVAMH